MTADADFIVVGSGAGGGPLAANLASAGFKVLLLEAGGDPCSTSDLGKWMYEVPIFHGLSTEFSECQWDYFVRHYSDVALQQQDTKFCDESATKVPGVEGIWYPRAAALGGCTTHNAMITVTPQDRDWDHIATLTGDQTWRADRMHQYFERLENCGYRPRPGSPRYLLKGLAWSAVALAKGRRDWRDWAHGHGFDGWLTTSMADPKLVFKDKVISNLLVNTVKQAIRTRLGNPLLSLFTELDPNDVRDSIDAGEGLALTPLAVNGGKRNGPRELLLRTQKRVPNNLTIQLHALASRILFDGKRAVGVEYLDGEHLYQADPAARGSARPPLESVRRRQVFAAREVIVCAGAFNSPQLLKLSGIGPADELARMGIEPVVDLPGVGRNLQDRYEVGVVSDFPEKFALLDGATFAPPKDGVNDPLWTQWQAGRGIYATNGSLIGILKRSRPELPEPDLYIFGLPGFFKGYFPGYSAQFERHGNQFTWAILKAYTENTAGTVKLRSKDPRDWPSIEFRYFSEGNDTAQRDVDAVVDGIEFVRAMNDKLKPSCETVPGKALSTRQALRDFVAREAWGHHASCTNRMGAAGDSEAVLDSRFRVRGTTGLRVVDASVFPRIPGYFIVTPVYMISEKAFDVIREDH